MKRRQAARQRAARHTGGPVGYDAFVSALLWKYPNAPIPHRIRGYTMAEVTMTMTVMACESLNWDTVGPPRGR
jgi:hypothetical protein